MIVAVAKLFWKDKKYEKAKKWFERAIALDPLVGDSWAYYYKFIKDCLFFLLINFFFSGG